MEKIVINRTLTLALLLSAPIAPAIGQAQPAAQQQPQPLSKATFLQQIDGAFVAVDTNKDGFTDRSEIEAAETKALAARKTQVIRGREGAFRQLDKDNNGQLTMQEFNAVIQAQALPKANATPFLQRLDTNKDGKVSLAENRAPASTQFDRADTNKDGVISDAERKAARN